MRGEWLGRLGALAGGTALIGVLLAIALGAAQGRGAAAAPADALLAYLRAIYARDYGEAYRWIASEDRAVKSRAQYVGENVGFSGVRLEMARALAGFIRLDDVQTTVDGDRASLSVRLVLPDANAPEIDRLVLGFEEERLAQLTPGERTRILKRLAHLGTTGRLPVIVGEDERWEVAREADGWRVASTGRTR